MRILDILIIIKLIMGVFFLKIITLKKKKILQMILVFIFTFSIFKFSTSFGMQNYYKVDFATGLVTATTLNVRSGPGTQYKIVATAKKNEYIRIFAGVGDWYIVQVEGDYVGAVSKKYIKPIYPNSGGGITSSDTGNRTGSTNSGSVGDNVTNINLTADRKSVV